MASTIPLLYKDCRLEGDTPLRQCQLIQLHLLYVFDRICKENNLTYFLAGGTALGAMRHGGFIPWDDDLDVGMPMKDYKKFLKIASNVLPKDVILQTPKTNPNTAIPFSKLRDGYSFYYEMRPDIRTTDFAGAFLDVIPFEEVPNIAHCLKIFFLRAISSSWMRKCYFMNIASDGYLKMLSALFLVPLFACLHAMMRLTISVLKFFIKSKAVAPLFECGYGLYYPKEWLYTTEARLFENDYFSTPKCIEQYLMHQYGDWREIPPPEKRPRHAKIILPTTSQELLGAMIYPKS